MASSARGESPCRSGLRLRAGGIPGPFSPRVAPHFRPLISDGDLVYSGAQGSDERTFQLKNVHRVPAGRFRHKNRE